MKFDTKIWHPNISSVTGAICLDILKDNWTPALTIRTALISLQALLCAPEPTDPQDAEVAKQYLSNRALFDQTARYILLMIEFQIVDQELCKRPSNTSQGKHH